MLSNLSTQVRDIYAYYSSILVQKQHTVHISIATHTHTHTSKGTANTLARNMFILIFKYYILCTTVCITLSNSYTKVHHKCESDMPVMTSPHNRRSAAPLSSNGILMVQNITMPAWRHLNPGVPFCPRCSNS